MEITTVREMRDALKQVSKVQVSLFDDGGMIAAVDVTKAQVNKMLTGRIGNSVMRGHVSEEGFYFNGQFHSVPTLVIYGWQG